MKAIPIRWREVKRRYAHAMSLFANPEPRVWHRCGRFLDLAEDRDLDRSLYGSAPSIYARKPARAARHRPLPNGLRHRLLEQRYRAFDDGGDW